MTQKDQREKEAREYAQSCILHTRDDWATIGKAYVAGCESESKRVVEWCENYARDTGRISPKVIEEIKREFGE